MTADDDTNPNSENDNGADDADSSDWRHVSGTGYEGIVIPTERFRTSIGTTAIEGPPPTEEEIEALEALIEAEIKESGIETLPAFEGLIDNLATFKRYYFAGVNVVSEAAKEPGNLPDRPEPFAPRLTAELDGHRVIMAEFSNLVGDNWKTEYDVAGIDGSTSDQFYALYLPETGTFWLQFQVGGEIDNTFH